MRTDYFDNLIPSTVPAVPATQNTSGDGGNPHGRSVSPLSPLSPHENSEAADSQTIATPESETPRGFLQHSQDSQQTGETPCTACGCGSLWRDTSGAWWCEQCTPPGNARVATWRNFSGAAAAQAPRPAEPWPADLAVDPDRVVINRAGFRRKDPDGRIEYLILPEVFKREVCGGLDYRAVAKLLRDRGRLVAEHGHLTIKPRGIGRVYCLREVSE